MGSFSHLFDLSFHLIIFYLWHEQGYIIWYVTAEIVWCTFKIFTTIQPVPACRFPHFTELAKDVRQKLLQNEHTLPGYVYYPDVETVEWINDIICRLWTPINCTIQKICREQVTALVNTELRKSVSMTFSFVTVEMGTVPFQITGVKSYSPSATREEIVLDIDIAYNGDAEFIVRVGYIKAGIKNLQIRGSLRLLMRPLLNEPPLIGGIHVYFLQQPTIRYQFTNILNFLNFDAIVGLLDQTIQRVLSRVVVAPNSLQVQISKNAAMSDLDIDFPLGVVRINLLSALQLEAADLQGVSNPFVQFKFGTKTCRSKTAENTLNPEWSEYFQFEVDLYHDKSPLDFTIIDSDVDFDTLLGKGRIDVSRIRTHGFIDELYKLEGVSNGLLHIQLEWLSLSDSADLLRSQVDLCDKIFAETSSRVPAGLCYISVISAADLPPRLDLTDPSPKAVFSLEVQNTQSTKIVENSRNPVWRETICLPLHSLKDDALLVQVIDSTTEMVLGSVTVKLSGLLEETGLKLDKPFGLSETNLLTTISLRIFLRTFQPSGKMRSATVDALPKISNPPESVTLRSSL